MPLINCKIHLELNWNNNCVMCGADACAGGDNATDKTDCAGGDKTAFKITSTKLYVPIVSLSTKDNVNLTKQLNERFKISVYWNEYKSKIETKAADNNNVTRFFLMLLFKGLIDCLFLLLTILIMEITKLKETVIENISSRE